MSEFSGTQILEAITDLIQAGDLERIPGLVKLLALQSPEKAQAALDLMLLGAELSRGSTDE